ncbi:uncharacterized protein LOC121711490 isoform X2 [Alosa sapidissima]|uniref:uncharacterized protein LOC121711490 isoform X2 n=1 Tax=Alosa sapidissima TaxID=34773 RepID=UPI001C092736|nr:uncharacterized protein LOC121711490 isoform X2 [Alosa sapidissima]
MAKLHNPTVGLLLTVLLLLQGSRGDSITVFSGAGGAATLSCENVISHYPDCSSTVWIYSRNTETTVRVVHLGKIRPDYTPRAERLRLLSDCSLHITDVTTEDAGVYTCRQYQSDGSQYGPDTPVYLSILAIYSRGTESKAGSDVELNCYLITNAGDCWSSVQSLPGLENVHLSWMNERGAELQNTNSLQISGDRRCSIRLTTPNPTHTQITWRCQLTAGGHVHTVRVPVNPTRTPVVTRGPAPPPPSTPPQPAPTATSQATPSQPLSTPSPGSPSVLVLLVALSTTCLLAVVAVCVAALLLKRARACGTRDGRLTSTGTTKGAADVLYSTVNKSAAPANSGDDKKSGDVTYAEVAHRSQAHALPPNAADSVTYATVNIPHKA